MISHQRRLELIVSDVPAEIVTRAMTSFRFNARSGIALSDLLTWTPLRCATQARHSIWHELRAIGWKRARIANLWGVAPSTITRGVRAHRNRFPLFCRGPK